MKNLILIGIIFLTSLTMNAQINVYKGTSSSSGDVICNLSNGNVYKKTSSYSGDIIFQAVFRINKLDSVTIELTLFGYFVTKN